MSKFIVHVLGLALLLSISLPMSAQDKPRKELNKLMKDLPVEVQQQILDFAQRKQQAYQAKVDALDRKAITAEELAKEKAAAAQPSMQVKPKPSGIAQPAAQPTPSAPPAPPKPYWEQKAIDLPQTTVQWYEEIHEFGKVVEGTKVTHTFKFKNNGDKPLELTRVKASCGCTVPNYSKEPIGPGEEGNIDITFNSTGKRGRQVKTITITGNFPSQRKILRIQGEIEPKSK